MKYSICSVLSNKVQKRNSPIDGVGTFAINTISKNEIVFIKGGYILTREKMYFDEKIDSYWPISDDYVLAAKEKKDVESIKLYINHSCSPNCGIHGDIFGISKQVINSDEEITFDYAFLDNEYNRFVCSCGSKDCRKIITGFDWQIRSLQIKYIDYFATYLKDKIEEGNYYISDKNVNEEIIEFCDSVFMGDRLNYLMKYPDNEILHCCLYEKNCLVSYAGLIIKEDEVEICLLAVRNNERNKGYGKRIVFWAETEALKHNLKKIVISPSNNYHHFFRKLGYDISGTKIIK